jgi:hypothetical protein
MCTENGDSDILRNVGKLIPEYLLRHIFILTAVKTSYILQDPYVWNITESK